MEKIKITLENVDEIIGLINQTMAGKKYWLDLGIGEMTSIEEYLKTDDFLGRGTVNRIVTAKAELTPTRYQINRAIKIDYSHLGKHGDLSHSLYDLGFSCEITIIGNDILIFEKNNTFISRRGGTSIYLECTEERVAIYNNKFVTA